jgi:hypothetical protein
MASVIKLVQGNVRSELLRSPEVVNECRTIAGSVQARAASSNPAGDYRLEFFNGRTRDWWAVENRAPRAMRQEADTGALIRATRSV